MHDPMIDVAPTTDADLLRRVFRQDPVAAAYLLGDLDEPFFERCRWLLATWDGSPVAVVAAFFAAAGPLLLTFGAPDGVERILARGIEDLPAQFPAKVPPEHEEALRRRYQLSDLERLWVMNLGPDEFRSAASTATVRRLTPDDSLADILRVYESYPGNFFEPSQLASGLYFGAFEGARLVSVAGTHVFSPRYGVAVLGNIVTAADARGRGHAESCTARLVAALLEHGCCVVALHVAETNIAAIAAYRRLGFAFHSLVLQATCTVTG